MDIRNLVNPANRHPAGLNPPTHLDFEWHPHASSADAQRPVVSGATPGVDAGLPLPTQQLQRAVSNQLPAPAISAIPRPTPYPPTPAQPLPIDLETLNAMPTSAHRVQAVVDRFEMLWYGREWSSLHHMLKQLALTYPKNTGAQLPPDLQGASEVFDTCKIIIEVFLQGSGHCYCNSAPSTPWMQLLRDQKISSLKAADMVHVITDGPLRRYGEEPLALEATIAKLSWLLPDWRMRWDPPLAHTKRIAQAMVQLFERLDLLHATESSTLTKSVLLSNILRAVKPPYSSPQMRDTLRACAAAVPAWLRRPLSEALMNIGDKEGADLYPPNELNPASIQQVKTVLNRLLNEEVTQERGRKVPLAEVRDSATEDEPARKRIRLDDLAEMQPGHVPGSAFVRPNAPGLNFAVPRSTGATAQPSNPADGGMAVDTTPAPWPTQASPAQELLTAIRSRQFHLVQAALAKDGAWSLEAQRLAQSMVHNTNSTATHTIFELVRAAGPAVGQDA